MSNWIREEDITEELKDPEAFFYYLRLIYPDLYKKFLFQALNEIQKELGK